MDLLTVLNQLGGQSVDLGGAARPDDAGAIAQLQMGGGGASLEGTPLFGSAPTNDLAAELQLGPGRLLMNGPNSSLPTAAGNATMQLPVQQAQVPVAPKPPLRGTLKEMLDTADQIATSLTVGTPVKQTLLPNPYGPGSYDPNNAQQVADVKAQGLQAQKVRQAQEAMQQLALRPEFAGVQKDITRSVLESLGVVPTAEQEAFNKAKGTAAGKAAGEGTSQSQGIDEIARKVADYTMPLPSGFALRSPYWQDVMKRATEINPEFDGTKYQSRQRIRNDFASGKAALNIRALNTAVDHLDALKTAGMSLENGDTRGINAFVNFVRNQTGDARITDFKNAATAVESELAAVFKGMGATDQEIKQWRENLSANMSPAQINGAIKTAVKLMAGRAGALGEQWRQTMGKTREEAILSPEAQGKLRAMGIDPAEADPTLKERAAKGNAPKGVPEGAVRTDRTFNGKVAYKLPNGKYWVED